MVRSRRESHHSDGITDQKSLQRTSATKIDPKRTWRLMARMSANEPICDMGDPNLLRYTTAVPLGLFIRGQRLIFLAQAQAA
jgi:hypothetical protein